MRPWLVAAFAVALAAPPAGARAAEAATAIVGVTVVHPDRQGEEALARDRTIVIRGRRIAAVGPAATTPVPPGAAVIDGKGKWAMPGLIDAHVHFFQSGNLYTRPDVADFNAWMPYERELRRNRERLPETFRAWLASGVTSVVDIGGPFWNFEVREAARASAAAPRVAVAGPLLSMVERPQLDRGDPPIVKVSSVAEARALTARVLEREPDFMKVWFIHRPGDDLAAQEEMVREAARLARAKGVPLAVHATELAVAKAALRAGATFLVHSVEDRPVDEEFLALARRNGAIYCPTLFVVMGYRLALSGTWRPTAEERRLADPAILAAMDDLAEIPKEKLPPRVAQLMAEPPAIAPSPTALANLRAVRDAGITIAMGTDAGNIGTLHGPSVFREMALMVRAGLTPLEVLRSATVGGAKALGLERELGAIAPGRLADLVILEADPTADVANAAAIHATIRDGRVFPAAAR